MFYFVVMSYILQAAALDKTHDKTITCEFLCAHLSTENKFNDSPEMFRTTGWRCCRPV